MKSFFEGLKKRAKSFSAAEFYLTAGKLVVVAGLFYTFVKGLKTASSPDYESAVSGIMSLHILKGQAFPVFFYGQAYMGALENYLTALIFKFFGVSAATLRVAPALFWAAFVAANYFLVKKVFGPAQAVLASLFLCLPTAAYFTILYNAWMGYNETLFFGTLILLVTVYVLEKSEKDEPVRRELGLLGFLSGLALWTHLLAAVYLLTAFILIFYRRGAGFFVNRRIYPFVIMFLIGFGPVVLFNLFPVETANLLNFSVDSSRRFQTAAFFFENKQPLKTKLAWNFNVLLNLPKTGIPLILGLQKNIGYWLVPGGISKVYYGFFGLVFLWLLVGRDKNIKAFLSFRRQSWSETLRLYPLLIIVINILVFSFGVFGFVFEDITIRYLLPVYTGLSVLVAEFLLWLLAKNVSAFVGALALIFYNLVYPEFFIHLDIPQFKRVPADEPRLIRRLEEMKINYIYANEITGMPVQFLSNQKILTSTEYLYGPYRRYNHKIKHPEPKEPVFVIQNVAMFKKLKNRFEAFLKSKKIAYREERIKTYSVYHKFSSDPRSYLRDNPIL